MSEINKIIKSPIAKVFRRASIKRRDATTGLFESSWYDISKAVKSYGKISNQVDSARRNKFKFGNAKLVIDNKNGEFNPHDSDSSLWYGYLNQQRTLIKIEAGYLNPVKNIYGVWSRNELPVDSQWDVAYWDATNVWDGTVSSVVFMGVLSGDLPLSDKNDVTLNVRPLTSIFQDFPARNLTGWTSTGVTASQFITMLRDQTDGSGSYIFRPFFNDTTSSWEISTTSNVFSNINTSTAADIVDKTAWDVVEKLAEAENFVPYITRTGVFKFISRTSVDTASSFEFHGAGSFSSEYGQTIKSVNSYGFKISNYYSRVQIKWQDANTSTSYAVQESTLTVQASNNPWVLGVRTLSFENLYIPTSTVANTLALSIFNDVSALKKEIQFTTTFITHLDLFDRFSIHYDPAYFINSNLWDQNDWGADNTSTSFDLIFDASKGDALILQGEEFKFLSFEIDLDNFQNTFLAREV